MILDQETVTWFSVDSPPDADTTVLIYAPQADEPVWLGYYDEGEWHNADATLAHWVEAWAPMPAGATAAKEAK